QFTVSTRGTEPLAYQWYYNQTYPLASGTNATLALTNVSPAQAGSYLVVVSNAYGSASSGPAHLAVVVPPMILSDPTSQLVTNGGFVVLSVSAEGDEPLSYQWYFNET